MESGVEAHSTDEKIEAVAVQIIRRGIMTIRKSNYQVINMCDFCENEFGSCGANPLFSYEIDVEKSARIL